MTKHHPILDAVFSTAVVGGAAVAGSLATDADSLWYKTLRKPEWQPPREAFPIVWLALYASAVITSTQVLNRHERDGEPEEASSYRRALVVNMALNAGWSYVFFRRRDLGTAAIGAGLLAASTASLARRAGRAGRGKALCLLPYAAWTTFAAVLSADIWLRNN